MQRRPAHILIKERRPGLRREGRAPRPASGAVSQNPFPIALSQNGHMATKLRESGHVADILSFATARTGVRSPRTIVSHKSVAKACGFDAYLRHADRLCPRLDG